MNNKNLTIIGIVLAVVVLAGGAFWYVNNSQKLKIQNDAEKVIDNNQQQNKQGQGEEKQQVKNDNTEENSQEQKGVDHNSTEEQIKNELWSQLMQDPKETFRDKNYFSINKINNNRTIVLGTYTNNGPGGANVFAYRLNSDEKWIIKITQEALLCSDTVKFSKDQIKFLKNNYINYCVEFDEDGFMHKHKL